MPSSPLHPLVAPEARPVVGVVHLPPLAGERAPPVREILEQAAADARAYQEAGFNAVLVENHGDTPYPKSTSPPHVPAVMARVAAALTETGLPIGVNVLRNDASAAMGIAWAARADFIRVNVLTGAVVADQGVIEGCAHDLAAYRDSLGPAARRVLVAADVQVKHARPLAARPIEEEARDAVHRAGADVLLVTGPATGRPADLEDVHRVRRATATTPVWVASGVTADTIEATLEAAHGAIVATAAKRHAGDGPGVDPERAREIAAAAGKRPGPRRA